VRITIGVGDQVTRGLEALKTSLDEIGWKRQLVIGSASQQADGEREFE
jgi:histidinol-phosphate aminotransferase